jgi:hypothetical protein
MRICGISAASFAAIAALSSAAPASAQALTREQQIAAAVLAAPEDTRAAATVLGFDATGRFVTLRTGTNDMVCHTDDPKTEGFEVSCFHRSILPYLSRGRELRADGLAADAVRNTRFKEMDEKKIGLPDAGATQYILTGAWDAASGRLQNQFLRWVIYTPYATPQSTGLSTRGGESVPWLMGGGTAGAHIMIVPPRRPAGG